MTVLGYVVKISNIYKVCIKEGDKLIKYDKIGQSNFTPITYSIVLGNKKLDPLPYTFLNSGFIVEHELKKLINDLATFHTNVNSISFDINDYNSFIHDSIFLKSFISHLLEIKHLLNIRENLNTSITRKFYDMLSPSEKHIIRLSFVMKLLYQNINNYIILFDTIKRHLKYLPNKLPLKGGGISRGFWWSAQWNRYIYKQGIPVYASANGL